MLEELLKINEKQKWRIEKKDFFSSASIDLVFSFEDDIAYLRGYGLARMGPKKSDVKIDSQYKKIDGHFILENHRVSLQGIGLEESYRFLPPNHYEYQKNDHALKLISITGAPLDPMALLLCLGNQFVGQTLATDLLVAGKCRSIGLNNSSDQVDVTADGKRILVFRAAKVSTLTLDKLGVKLNFFKV